MTEVIRPKFDVVRGWAGGGSIGSAYDKTFGKVEDAGGTAIKVRQGVFVTLKTNGAVTPVTTLDKAVPIWLVVEGNDPSDSYSGDYLDKVVAIKGSYEVLLSDTMYVNGSYTPGTKVVLDAGKVKVGGGVDAGVGHVTEVDSASGTIKVAFSL